MAFSGFALAVLLLLLSMASRARPCADQEKSALLRFVAGLSRDGGLATSWRTSNGTAGCCSWEGVACDGDGAVVEVSLPGRGLQGPVSPALGDIAGLLRLNLSHNALSGELPLEQLLSSSSGLVAIDISFNRLEGELRELMPSSATRGLPSQVLNISSNLFTGEFPSSITNLRSLAHLDLGGNLLNGKIPDSIGELRRLEVLHLDHNNMSGELPSALSNCTNLITINLRNNYFSGELANVDFSTLINLKTLDLLFNNFSGTIPESIYSCRSLNALRLADNKLHGQLSPRIANLKSLIFLSASFNNFTNITNALHVLKGCKELSVLIIGSNFKGEAMPEDETLDGFQNLQFLSLSRCSLSGKIPLWLSKLKNLEMLLLHNNNLTGSIPVWIKSLKLLFHVDMSENNLTGEIPTDLMEMPVLTTENTSIELDQRVFLLLVYRGTSFEYRVATAFPKMLSFGRNNLTGMIPKEIGQLKSLAILNFSSNRLSGEMPPQLRSLTNLQVLDLSNNHLTGAIPMELNSLHFLAAFNVSNNDLEGPIPAGVQFSTFTSSSFGGNPKLCGGVVDRPCGLAEAHHVSRRSREQTHRMIAFAIAFGAFFGVGVLYDQMVLSKYFG